MWGDLSTWGSATTWLTSSDVPPPPSPTPGGGGRSIPWDAAVAVPALDDDLLLLV